tara:strand:+ start:21574 stop:21870 length:297 start_codon:yes stop_codon:yes gene_type:complete
MGFESIKTRVLYPLIVMAITGQFYFSWTVTESVSAISSDQRVVEVKIAAMESQIITLQTVMVTKDELLETLKRIELFIQNETLRSALRKESNINKGIR